MHIFCSMSFVHKWWPKWMKNLIRINANANALISDSCNGYFCTSGKQLLSLILHCFLTTDKCHDYKKCRWSEGGKHFGNTQGFMSIFFVKFSKEPSSHRAGMVECSLDYFSPSTLCGCSGWLEDVAGLLIHKALFSKDYAEQVMG